MTSSEHDNYRLEKVGAAAGILSIVFYLAAVLIPFIPDFLSRLLGFSFPLLWIIAFMGLYRYLKVELKGPSLEIAYIFGIIGAALACALIVVQQANILWHQEAMATAASEQAETLLKATYNGANRVQAGLDVAFDIFITISWFLFSVNIVKSKSFSAILGWFGCLISAGLLVFNMITFPDAPAEAGLFDLGPFLGLYTLIVFIWFSRNLFKKKPPYA